MAAAAITGLTNNPILLALMLNLILLVLGCIMDMAPIILIATPILLPIATSIGLDPIQFGIMVVLNCGIGLLTPPVGAVLFIGSAVAKVPMEKVVKATLRLACGCLSCLGRKFLVKKLLSCDRNYALCEKSCRAFLCATPYIGSMPLGRRMGHSEWGKSSLLDYRKHFGLLFVLAAIADWRLL